MKSLFGAPDFTPFVATVLEAVLSQICLFEAKCENRVLKNQ
jgi:hypothetical protein